MNMCGVHFLPHYWLIESNLMISISVTIVTVFFIPFTNDHVIHNLIKNNLITMWQPYTLHESSEMNSLVILNYCGCSSFKGIQA